MSTTLNAEDLPGIMGVYAKWAARIRGTWPGLWIDGGHGGNILPLAGCPMAQDLACYWLEKRGHPCEWARRIPEALAECCRRVGRGEEPPWGVLSAWDEGNRRDLNEENPDYENQSRLHGSRGWSFGEGQHYRSGPETGDEGKRLADEAARAAGWWLL